MRIRQNIRKYFFKAVAIQLLVAGTLFIAVPPAPSLAAPAKDTTVKASGDQSPISGGSLPTPNADDSTIADVLRIVFGIIGAFAVLNITFSGLKYITSAGNEQKVAEAKNGIVYSLVGLMIAVMAEAIVAFVVHRVSV